MLNWPCSGLLPSTAVIWHGMAVIHAAKLSAGNGPYRWQLLRHNQRWFERVLACSRWNHDSDCWNTSNIHVHIKVTKILKICDYPGSVMWTWKNRVDAYDTEFYCLFISNWRPLSFPQRSLSIRQKCQVPKETHCIEKRSAEERSIQSWGQKKCSFTVVGLCLIASS